MGWPYSTNGRHDECIQHIEWKRLRGRRRRGWENNTKSDPKQIGWENAEWINLAQDRDQWLDLTNTVMNFRFP
jgi:hypothetical protein